MSTIPAWRFEKGTFIETTLAWDGDVEISDWLTELGYTAAPGNNTIYGKKDHDYLAVFSGNLNAPSTYLTIHNFRSIFEVVLFVNYPDLIEYLGKVVPLVMAAVESYRYDEPLNHGHPYSPRLK